MDTLFEQIALANIEQARREKGGILPTHARLDGGGGGSSRPQAREEEDLPLPPAQQSEADDEDDGLVTFSSRLFPNLKSAANSGSLPLGAVFEPFAEPRTAPPLLRRDPVRCQICGAFANRFCAVDGRNGRWRCLFCNAASFCREFVGSERAACPELQAQVVDYELPSSLSLGAQFDPGPGLEAVALVLDETLDAAELDGARAALAAAVAQLPDATHVCLVTAGASVCVHSLAAPPGPPPHPVSLVALPGSGEGVGAQLRAAHAAGARLSSPLGECRPALSAALAALRPHRPAEAPAAARPRALGAAVDVGLRLLRAAAPLPSAADPWAPARLRSRLLLLAGGPPNCGPGAAPAGAQSDAAPAPRPLLRSAARGRRATDVAAQQRPSGDSDAVWAALGAAARAQQTACDVMSCGALPIGAARLLPLARASGGDLVALPDGFGDPGLGAALRAGWLLRAAASAGGVDVRCAPLALAPRRLLGPLAPLPPGARLAVPLPGGGEGAGAGGGGGGGGARDSAAAAALLPLTRAASVSATFALEEDIPERWVYFQFVAGAAGARAEVLPSLRVVTRRLRCAPRAAEYAAQLRPLTAALLAARCDAADALARLRSPGAAAAAEAAAAARGGGGGGGGGGAFAADVTDRLLHAARVHGAGARRRTQLLSPPLAAWARALYHAQRGPLCASAAGGGAEGAVCAQLALLAQPAAAAEALLSPRLYRLGDDDDLFPLPAADWALGGREALLLDAGTEVTGWLGAEAAAEPGGAEALGRLRAAAQRLAQGRLPPPSVRVCAAGGSAARRLAGRLEPASKDGARRCAGEASFAGLPEAERAARLLALLAQPTDVPSFLQWLGQLRLAVDEEAELAAAGTAAVVGKAASATGGAVAPPLAPATPMCV